MIVTSVIVKNGYGGNVNTTQTIENGVLDIETEEYVKKMTKKNLIKIFIEEIESYTGSINFMDKDNKTENAFKAKKLYYSMLHIMKTCSGLTYKAFEPEERRGMLNTIDYSKKYKCFRKEIKIVADIIHNRILKERSEK